MIGFIKGTIEDIQEDCLIVDNHGMGWIVYVPGSLLGGHVRIGDEVKLYTSLQVREDAMTLYGFFSKDDLEVFRLLLGVSGIGPKGALGILSALSPDDLRFAVLADDAAAISRAPGIGKKTAQKLILELKDRFALNDAFEKKLSHMQEAAPAVGDGLAAAQADAIEALTALGYSGTEALQAVRKVELSEGMDSEAILKAALRNIF